MKTVLIVSSLILASSAFAENLTVNVKQGNKICRYNARISFTDGEGPNPLAGNITLFPERSIKAEHYNKYLASGCINVDAFDIVINKFYGKKKDVKLAQSIAGLIKDGIIQELSFDLSKVSSEDQGSMMNSQFDINFVNGKTSNERTNTFHSQRQRLAINIDDIETAETILDISDYYPLGGR